MRRFRRFAAELYRTLIIISAIYAPADAFTARTDELDIVEGVKLPCPFCGLEVRAGYDRYKRGLVLHFEPRCSQFDKLDALEFLTMTRQRLQAGGPS